jgi:hippurate hydrolase
MSLQEDARAVAGELRALRHALHREPELGLNLPRTQATVLGALKDLPLSITLGERLTSVTAVLHGAQPGPAVLLRADMDALPITELADVPYRARREGLMHACGHDLHTSMLAGAARLLAARRSELKGNVIFMFQPGEEGWDGAQQMLNEGVLDAADRSVVAAYALHVMSAGWPQGMFFTRPGPLLASSDDLIVTVKGAGGHGSSPHQAKDPIPVACETVTALQSFLTRTTDPSVTTVLTVGSFHAGTASNVIPETARFEATLRTISPGARRQLLTGAARVCEGIAAAHGLQADVTQVPGYPVTVNSAAETAFAGVVISELFGPDRFTELEHPLTNSEDFSLVLDKIPGAMIMLSAVPAGIDPLSAPDNHSAYAVFDDAVLADGAALYAELAMRRLESPEQPAGARVLPSPRPGTIQYARSFR